MGGVHPRNYLHYLLEADPDEKITHPSDTAPTEHTIVESLTAAVSDRAELWADSEVDLWSANATHKGRAVPPQQAVREFGHPLQPDIDVLVGRLEDDTRQPPLVGMEVKYFGKYNGISGHKLLPKRVNPEGYSMGGFYSGLGQALSLVSMGVDYVYLWHVFDIPRDIYEDGRDSADQTADHVEVLNVYTDKITRILDTHDLPVGYFAHGVATGFDNRFIRLGSPRPAPRIEPEESTAPIRRLLERTLSEQPPSRALSEFTGTGTTATVEAEISGVTYIKKDQPRMPDLKGVLRDPASGETRPFVVDAGVSHPYFSVGDRFRFEGVRDHYYESNDEVQVRITGETRIIKLDG